MSKLYRSLLLVLAVVLFILTFASPSMANGGDGGGGGDGGSGDSGGGGTGTNFWFEAQAVSGKNPSKVIGWYERDSVKGPFGFFVSVVKASDGYRSAYVGPTLVPIDGLIVGAAIGRESMPNEASGVRRAFFFDVDLGKVKAFGIFERGVTGPWDKVQVTYALSERLGVGLMHEKLLGFGPRVEYNFPGKTKPQLWIAAVQGRYPNADDIVRRITTVIVGINISF